jgi:hypothetical protein
MTPGPAARTSVRRDVEIVEVATGMAQKLLNFESAHRRLGRAVNPSDKRTHRRASESLKNPLPPLGPCARCAFPDSSE